MSQPSRLNDVLRFIFESRETGIPDEVIFKGLQVAFLELTEREFGASRPISQPVKQSTRPVVGFVNSTKK
jgi:hypothetical protein